MRGLRWWSILCAALGSTALVTHAAGADAADEPRVTVLREAGIGGDWSRVAPHPIAYSLVEADGYYRVHLMDPDGSHDLPLRGEGTGLPRRHVGAPAWHPDGSCLAVIAEKPEHPGSSFEALPGFGGHSDLWLLAADGAWATRLLETAESADDGLLFPFFSPDGRSLTWTQRVEGPTLWDLRKAAGCWVIKIADVVGAGAASRLARIRTFEPGGRAFREGYGFTPDGKRLAFCSDAGKPSFFDEDIYTIDAGSGGDLRQLTDGDYNEHAFLTPDGASMVWMTNHGFANGATEWWAMDAADGAHKRRLSWFNTPGHASSASSIRYCGFGCFSPDGRRFVADVQTNLFTQASQVVMIDLPSGLTAPRAQATPARPAPALRAGSGAGPWP